MNLINKKELFNSINYIDDDKLNRKITKSREIDKSNIPLMSNNYLLNQLLMDFFNSHHHHHQPHHASILSMSRALWKSEKEERGGENEKKLAF
jgi:hypothetical protein